MKKNLISFLMIFVFWPITLILSLVTSYFVNLIGNWWFLEQFLFLLDLIFPYLFASLVVEKLRPRTFRNPFFLYPMLSVSFLLFYWGLIVNPNLYTFLHYLDLFFYTLIIIYMGFYRKGVMTNND